MATVATEVKKAPTRRESKKGPARDFLRAAQLFASHLGTAIPASRPATSREKIIAIIKMAEEELAARKRAYADLRAMLNKPKKDIDLGGSGGKGREHAIMKAIYASYAWTPAVRNAFSGMYNALDGSGVITLEEDQSEVEILKQLVWCRTSFGSGFKLIPDYTGKKAVAELTTDPITLKDSRGDSADLGPFKIVLDSSAWRDGRGLTEALKLIAVTPQYSRAAKLTHPHIRAGQLCLGEGSGPLIRALQSGRIRDAFDIILAIITTYNEKSPHEPLAMWGEEKVTCGNCGVRFVFNEKDGIRSVDGRNLHRACSATDHAGDVYLKSELVEYQGKFYHGRALVVTWDKKRIPPSLAMDVGTIDRDGTHKWVDSADVGQCVFTGDVGFKAGKLASDAEIVVNCLSDLIEMPDGRCVRADCIPIFFEESPHGVSIPDRSRIRYSIGGYHTYPGIEWGKPSTEYPLGSRVIGGLTLYGHRG